MVKKNNSITIKQIVHLINLKISHLQSLQKIAYINNKEEEFKIIGIQLSVLYNMIDCIENYFIYSVELMLMTSCEKTMRECYENIIKQTKH